MPARRPGRGSPSGRAACRACSRRSPRRDRRGRCRGWAFRRRTCSACSTTRSTTTDSAPRERTTLRNSGAERTSSIDAPSCPGRVAQGPHPVLHHRGQGEEVEVVGLAMAEVVARERSATGQVEALLALEKGGEHVGLESGEAAPRRVHLRRARPSGRAGTPRIRGVGRGVAGASATARATSAGVVKRQTSVSRASRRIFPRSRNLSGSASASRVARAAQPALMGSSHRK